MQADEFEILCRDHLRLPIIDQPSKIGCLLPWEMVQTKVKDQYLDLFYLP